MQVRTPRRRRTGDRDERLEMYRRELVERAGLYSRLGYPPSRAIARLQANLHWDFSGANNPRPKELSDKAIADLVKSTYLRRQSR